MTLLINKLHKQQIVVCRVVRKFSHSLLFAVLLRVEMRGWILLMKITRLNWTKWWMKNNYMKEEVKKVNRGQTAKMKDCWEKWEMNRQSNEVVRRRSKWLGTGRKRCICQKKKRRNSKDSRRRCRQRRRRSLELQEDKGEAVEEEILEKRDRRIRKKIMMRPKKTK